MKNIHILPTDKPSRLRFFCGRLELMRLVPKKSDIIFQHIYITSDEEIKEGDFGYDVVNNFVTKITKNLLSNYLYKKIILTTDQDLIDDGVQAIDDEFLDWFVKNPTCEYVEIHKDKGFEFYEIISMYVKEEPKQEEPKQETKYSEDEVRALIIKALTHNDYDLCGSLSTRDWEIRPANFFIWFEHNKKK
jgi:hypothetical protein